MIDYSYGTIPIFWQGKTPLVFLLQHRNGSHWGFPKGHAEKKETPKEAALRELFEETKLLYKKNLFLKPLVESYSFTKNHNRIDKTVTYFLIEVEKKDFILDRKEIIDGGWFSYKEAMQTITFAESKKVLQKAFFLLESND